MLDFVPASLRVLRIRRPKYGCRACGTIHQAAAPERPIAKGLASPDLTQVAPLFVALEIVDATPPTEGRTS